MSTPASSTARLTVAASLGILIFGIVMALLGAILPLLSKALGVTLAQAGALFFWMNLAMLLAAFLLGRLMDRFGMKIPLAAGPCLVAAALLLLATAESVRLLVAAAMLLGVGGGMLNGGANTLVADLNPEPVQKAAALNRLGVFFGFGAVLMPFTIGALVEVAGWRLLLVAAALLAGAAALLSATPAFPAPKQREKLTRGRLGALLAERLLWTLGLLLFCQSGCEFALGGFLSSFFAGAKQVPVSDASYLLALYWAALMAGRGVLSRYVGRLGPYRTVIGCAILAAVSLLGLRAASGSPGLALGAALLGFGVSGIYPTVLGIAGAAWPQESGTVFGILFTFGLAGGMSFPWAVGQAGSAAGLGTALLIPAAAFTVIALLAAAASKMRAAAG